MLDEGGGLGLEFTNGWLWYSFKCKVESEGGNQVGFIDPYFVFSSDRSLVYFVKGSVHFLTDLLGREGLGGLGICSNGLA